MATIIQQGRFTSDGNTKILRVRSDVDWMKIINYTVADDDTQTTGIGVEYYWQRGMSDDTGIEYKKSNAANAAQLVTALASGGFTRIDSSNNPLGAKVAITAGTNAVQPVMSTGDTSGLVAGDVVRLSGMTGQESLSGIDFQVDTIVANTSFRIAYAMANTPGAVATAGFWRKVKYDPIYYPQYRYIANITRASNAVVTCTVDHGFTVGQKVRMVVPSEFSMIEMDGLQATITAVTSSTITLDIDSSSFTAFTFALPADAPFSPALVVPLGQDTAQSLSSSVDVLADAADNQAYIGMTNGS
jgi:hypothetical protein